MVSACPILIGFFWALIVAGSLSRPLPPSALFLSLQLLRLPPLRGRRRLRLVRRQRVVQLAVVVLVGHLVDVVGGGAAAVGGAARRKRGWAFKKLRKGGRALFPVALT